ncbi:MAG: VCBS repeat-containing protein [Nitrospirae bacterium]|nr:VCBS repeat-containing protein [Nitrospirota bacterium]
MHRSFSSSILKHAFFFLILFAGLSLADAYFSSPALALTDCSTASAPCAEDPVIGDNNTCNACHSITIVGGNRNGTDRPITKSVASNRHVLDARQVNWTSTVTSMVGKGAGGGSCDAVCIEKIAAFMNTNYCPSCAGPIMGSVTVSGVATSGATIGWATDAPATSCVIYGTTNPPSGGNTCNPADPSYDPNNATMTQGHSVPLTNLTPNTPYYVVHQSTSATGTATYTLARKFTTLDSTPPPTNGGPGTIISLAVGDYNGDANPDLAIGVSIFNYVISYLGNGLGGFTEGQTLTNVGVKPLGITTGGVKADFDGDNVADLAVANFGEVANDVLSSANVAIFLGTGAATPKPNPNNAFATTPVSTISLDASATAVAAGDFNRDGHMDLAVASISVDGSTGSVRVFLGDGTGHFAATPVATIPVKVRPPTITIEAITPNPDCLGLPANVTATGTKLTDSGEYFLDDVTPLSIISFAEDGTSIVLRIPAGTTAGSHDIVGHLGADSATGAFTVNPRTVTFSGIFQPSLTYGVSSSTQLTIQGSGFVLGSTITLGSLTGTTVLGTSASALNPFVYSTSTLMRMWWPNTSLVPGLYDLTITNNDSCAGTVSAAGVFTVVAPQPTVTGASPTSAVYGVTGNREVRIGGTNFLPGATVTLGTLTGTAVSGPAGASASNPFVWLTSGVIGVWWPNTSMPPAAYTATVTNPAVSGGLSASLGGAFTVEATQPTVSLASPASVIYGATASQQISVSGSNFLLGARVDVGGISCVTVAGTSATASVPCVLAAPSIVRFWWNNTALPPAVYTVNVTNPAVAGGLSGSLAGAFTVNQAVPTISSISPTSLTYGVTASREVQIFGSNFVPGSTITIGSLTGTTVSSAGAATAANPFVYSSNTTLRLWWPNTSLLPGSYAVTVTNPLASGGLSATLPAASGLQIVAPQPTISIATPSPVTYGITASSSVTISGSNFVLGATITVGSLSGTTVSGSVASVAVPFVFTSSNQVRFWWPNTSLPAGVYAVTVTNPVAANGLSATLAGGFTVTAPQPTVTSTSPNPVTYGVTAGSSITIYGSNFMVGDVITVGSLSGTTVSGSVASAAVPFVYTTSGQVKFWWANTSSLPPGVYPVQVASPAAAGGLSATLAGGFTVTAPQPTIGTLSLASVTYGVTASQSITINGTNFVLGATITIQGPGGTLAGTTVSGSIATSAVKFVYTTSGQVKFWWGNTSLPAGTYDVIVTSPTAAGGLSATKVGGFVVN